MSNKSQKRIAVDIGGTVDRIKYPALGCIGGHDGACGHLALASGKLLKGKQQIPAGETLVFQTPGGGGYGDPRKRKPQLVARDNAAGLIGKDSLKRVYGVVLKPNGSVDLQATRQERRR